jgi:hypothetical protein
MAIDSSLIVIWANFGSEILSSDYRKDDGIIAGAVAGKKLMGDVFVFDMLAVTDLTMEKL